MDILISTIHRGHYIKYINLYIALYVVNILKNALIKMTFARNFKMKKVLRRKIDLAKLRVGKYTINKKPSQEVVDVTQFVNKINNIKLPPHQLRELGLQQDWQKNVSYEFVEKVVTTAERYKKDLKELSKR